MAPLEQDWKAVASLRHRPLAAGFEQADTTIRGRNTDPVLLAERFCGTCGCLLAVDVEIASQGRGATVSSFGEEAAAAVTTH